MQQVRNYGSIQSWFNCYLSSYPSVFTISILVEYLAENQEEKNPDVETFTHLRYAFCYVQQSI